MSTRIQRIRRDAGDRCGYCLAPQDLLPVTLQIEHYIPRDKGGSNDDNNLWLACSRCNRAKGSFLTAEDPHGGQQVRLFNPRQDHWFEHFEFMECGTQIGGRTSIGRATERLLGFNDVIPIRARANWVSVGWFPPDAIQLIRERSNHLAISTTTPRIKSAHMHLVALGPDSFLLRGNPLIQVGLDYLRDGIDDLAVFGWASFLKLGRGSIVVRNTDSYDTRLGVTVSDFGYMTLEEAKSFWSPTLAEKVERYDPETALVLSLLHDRTHTLTIEVALPVPPPQAYEVASRFNCE